jgi:uncharacterized repeat protein (TIGR01451 family)
MGSNVYLYSGSFGRDTGLAPPLNSNDKPAGLSNLRFCSNTEPPLPEYDVSIAKTADEAIVAPGGIARWTVTVTNTGKDAIPFDIIEVSDPTAESLVPMGEEPVALQPGASFQWAASRTVVDDVSLCGTEILNSASVSLVEYPTETPGDEETNPVPVTVGGAVCDPPTETTSIIPPPPPPAVTAFRPATGGLSIKKTGSKKAVVGGRVTYRIVVRNTGATDATGVVLRDIAPGVFAWGKKATGATLKGRTMTWKIGTIPAGGKVTKKVTLLVKMTKAKRACNIARVTSTNAGRYRSKACTKLSVAMRPATPVTG